MIEVDSADVVKIIQQFFKENNLLHSLQTLQSETAVTLNTIEDIPKFTSDILHGKWGSVLNALQFCSLPENKQEDLYEQIILELLEAGEIDSSFAMLETKPLQRMHQINLHRYLRLKNLAGKNYFDSQEAYFIGTNKEKRRNDLVESICHEVQSVPSGRLLSLLSQSIKWQKHIGQLSKGDELDLFRGDKPIQRDKLEKLAEHNSKVIKFGKNSYANSAFFSPDGEFLITGSSDGFIEVWDFDTGKLRNDLKYQAEDELMIHDSIVMALNFSSDSELIVSGDKSGKIKIWRLFTGDCLVRFENAHLDQVTSVEFNLDGTQVLSSSLDKSVRIHGLRSQRQLKQFWGHENYVNKAIFSSDCSTVISCSHDGTVKVWIVKSTNCIFSFLPEQNSQKIPVKDICLNPNARHDQIFCCLDSNNIVLCSIDGKILRIYQNKAMNSKIDHFTHICPSARGQLLYCTSENAIMYVFNTETGEVVFIQKIHSNEILGCISHPHQNVIATYATDRTVKIWRV